MEEVSNKKEELTFIQKVIWMILTFLWAIFLLGMIGIIGYLNIIISSMMIAVLFYKEF